MAIDLAVFAQAHPELGLMSDTPNNELIDRFIDQAFMWSFRQKWDAQTIRFEAVKHKKEQEARMRRSLAPRKRSRAFRQKQTINQ